MGWKVGILKVDVTTVVDNINIQRAGRESRGASSRALGTRPRAITAGRLRETTFIKNYGGSKNPCTYHIKINNALRLIREAAMRVSSVERRSRNADDKCKFIF